MTDQPVEGPFTPASTASAPTVTLPTTVEASTARRQPATFDMLVAKPRRQSDVVITTNDADGNAIELVVRFRAISSKEYDDLVAKHKPTREQADRGAQYNADTFAPALISACAIAPMLTLEQATQLYTSPEWSSGEIGGLFFEAIRVCNAGLDVPFTVSG